MCGPAYSASDHTHYSKGQKYTLAIINRDGYRIVILKVPELTVVVSW